MTFTEFMLYAIEYDQQHHKERAGQSAFNALHNADAELANEIRGTDLDPFYDDDVLPEFWFHLERRW